MGTQILTPREIADRYRICERKVTALAKKGEIPAFRIGKLWRFRGSEIEVWEKGKVIENRKSP